MKLPLLLSHYLKEHQLLRLPGLGSFRYNGQPVVSEGETSLGSADIRFESGSVIQADEGLIDYIKQKTGKIKPLAIADLSSYIESGLQMLNIGKPFYIEGIGTIQKKREGGFDFVAREMGLNRQDEGSNERMEQNDKKRSLFDDEKYVPTVNPWQKVIVAALIIGGLAIVVLGGYYLYNENNGSVNIQDTTIPVKDSVINRPDSLYQTPPDSTTSSMASYAAAGPEAYKFILETTDNKKRALKRYNQLRSYFIDIKMDTLDANAYKLYFLIPSTAADTLRIKDSLSRYYTSKVRIEL